MVATAWNLFLSDSFDHYQQFPLVRFTHPLGPEAEVTANDHMVEGFFQQTVFKKQKNS